MIDGERYIALTKRNDGAYYVQVYQTCADGSSKPVSDTSRLEDPEKPARATAEIRNDE